MKKSIFLTAMFIIGILFTTYGNSKWANEKVVANRYYNNVVSFVERGVEFRVFLDGNFDFSNAGYYNRHTKSGLYISYDYNGQVKRIENIRIKYNRYGNVKRIGKIRIKYKRGQLVRVGKLKVVYNRWGDARFIGRVKKDYYYCDDDDDDDFYDDDFYEDDDCDINIIFRNSTIFDYDHSYFYKNDFNRNYRKLREDNRFYYYQALPNAKVKKRHRIIRRKRAATPNKRQPSRRSETIMVR